VARKKFYTEIWAEAFLDATGKDAEKTLLCLKTLSAPIMSRHGLFFGYSGSLELEKVLRECAETAGDDAALEYAIRFICLLVEKKSFRFVNSFIRRIEQKLDEQKEILSVTLETASPMDSNLEHDMAIVIKEKIGVADVRMITRVRPELIGGYLLRIGAFYVDASVKGQLEKMRSELSPGTRGKQ
jgi:ATP synthase F1 delta subunit